MRKGIIILLAALTACTAKAPLSLQVVRSEMQRCPQASYIDGQEGKLKWNYTTGLELKAFLDVYEISRQARNDNILAYVENWYDAIIDSTGTIYNYKRANYSQDHICPGRTLFQLYDVTGKEKYRMAMDTLYRQIQEQPRTPEGGFWHKKVYPNQMWLDGLYMLEPFYTEYTNRYVPDSLKAANYADIAHQFTLIAEKTLDYETGLLRHAWDSSHEMFWCDKTTGQSEHAWGRALGWYTMALVDVIDLMPEGEQRSRLISILNSVMEVVCLSADMQTGMWYQVPDSPYRAGNYLEATCSAMFVYVMLKGTRLGILRVVTPQEAEKAFDSLLKTFVRVDEAGLVNLDRCCEVAGLGGKQERRGDFEYYINEPIRSNDPKGIGPLIWAALEMENR